MNVENVKNYTNSNVKFLRENKAMSQPELAEALGIDQSTLAKWENNTRNITLEWAIKISDFFGIFIGDFIDTDLRIDNKFDELEILFDKHKDILTEQDKRYMRMIIEERMREIDKQLNEE